MKSISSSINNTRFPCTNLYPFCWVLSLTSQEYNSPLITVKLAHELEKISSLKVTWLTYLNMLILSLCYWSCRSFISTLFKSYFSQQSMWSLQYIYFRFLARQNSLLCFNIVCIYFLYVYMTTNPWEQRTILSLNFL